MPIPLRPIDPCEYPARAARPVLPAPAPRPARAALSLPRFFAPFGAIRREPDLAVAAPKRPSDNDGWPCQPYTTR